MNRVFNPVLFLLANAPDVEKNLEMLMTMLQATTDSVKNIRSGIDNFQATILQMAPNQAKPSPAHTPTAGPVPTEQPSEPGVTPGPSTEPAAAVEPGPVIQIPFDDPPGAK